MNVDTPALGPAGLERFEQLRSDAIDAVTERFYACHDAVYARFGQRGRDACREDLGFHLEFLRPVLEFGIVQPMVDYLRWLASVLAVRDIPAEHLSQSLDWLSEFFATHMAEPDAGLVVKALHLAKEKFLHGDAAGPAGIDPNPNAWTECEAFASALLSGDRRAAHSLFDGCLDQGRGLVETELQMVQPALYTIGKKWQDNQVTVAQEHLATAIAQSVMMHGLLKSQIPAANGSTIVLACVEGNQHAVGLQMVADAFQLAGWDVQYLGANVPTNALIKHVAQFKPNLLGLSVSFAHQLRVVKDIMSRLTQSFGAARPPVIVGGLAINQFGGLVRALGVDTWSRDAGSAVASASQLAGQAG